VIDLLQEALTALKEDGPILIYLVGQPAVGQTTLAGRLGRELDLPVVNHQQFYEAVTGHRAWEGVGSRVQDWVCDVLGYYLLSGQSLIFDAQTYTRKARLPYLQVARGLQIPTYGIWVQCEQPDWDGFRAARGYPPELTKALQTLFEPPQVLEGFRMITSHLSSLPPLPRLD
jgi:predicted kinase